MRIDEIFRKPYKDPITWSEFLGAENIRAVVKDQRGREIVVLFSGIGPGAYDVIFSVGGLLWATGKGSQFEVYGKVMQIMREFVQKYNPQLITFSAFENVLIPVYNRLVSKFAAEMGFKQFTPPREWLKRLWAKLKRTPDQQYYLKRIG